MEDGRMRLILIFFVKKKITRVWWEDRSVISWNFGNRWFMISKSCVIPGFITGTRQPITTKAHNRSRGSPVVSAWISDWLSISDIIHSEYLVVTFTPFSSFWFSNSDSKNINFFFWGGINIESLVRSSSDINFWFNLRGAGQDFLTKIF